MLKKLVNFILTFIFISGLCFAEPVNTPDIKQPIKVGVLLGPPFVIDAKGKYEGLAIDIWELVANQSQWLYQYKEYTDVTKSFEDLNNGEIDILIGSIPVDFNSLRLVDFSRPIFIDRIGVVTKEAKFSFFNTIKFIFYHLIDYRVLLFLLLFFLFSHLLWIVEWRRTHTGKYRESIGHAIWYSFLSFFIWETSDKVQTFAGRIILGIWLIISVLALAFITASITSAITISLLEVKKTTSIHDFTNKPIAYVASEVDVDDIYKLDAIPIEVNSFTDAVKILEQGKVQAIITSLPSAKYYLLRHREENLAISSDALYYVEYAFAFPKNSSFRKQFDLAYDAVKFRFHLAPLCAKYVGEHSGKFCNL